MIKILYILSFNNFEESVAAYFTLKFESNIGMNF